MKYYFTVARHEDFGELGLCPKWMADAHPLSGMAVAHDILEHFPGDTDPVAGEFKALGAALYIRGLGGYWLNSGNVNPPDRHVAADIVDIIGRVRSGAQKMPAAPIRLGAVADDRVGDWIARIPRHVNAELKDRGERPLSVAEVRTIAHYVCKGYGKARSRYRDHDPWELAQFFSTIEGAANTHLKHANEGDTVRFEIRFKNLSLDVGTLYQGEI